MPAVTHKPDVAQEEIRGWLRDNFSIDGILEPLPGECDLNFKLCTPDDGAFVCKISKVSDDELELLAAQNEVMSLLNQRDLTAVPTVLTSNRGGSLVPFSAEGCVGRVLSFVPGKVLANCAPYGNRLIRNLGRTVGRLNQALAGYDHPAFHHQFDWDLANAVGVVERYSHLIADPTVRDGVTQIHAEFEEIAVPRFDQLRKSVIHNDANDYNVLAEGDQITGLIDFGDMVHTFTICDLAVAMAYATLGADDIPQLIREMAVGYNEFIPIEDEEVAVLFPMLRMRLAVSACMAAHQMRLRPDDPYLTISQEPIRNTLPKLLALDASEGQTLLEDALA